MKKSWSKLFDTVLGIVFCMISTVLLVSLILAGPTDKTLAASASFFCLVVTSTILLWTSILFVLEKGRPCYSPVRWGALGVVLFSMMNASLILHYMQPTEALDMPGLLGILLLKGITVALLVLTCKTAFAGDTNTSKATDNNTVALYQLEADNGTCFNAYAPCTVNMETMEVIIPVDESPARMEYLRKGIKEALDGDEEYDEFVIIDGQKYPLVSKAEHEHLEAKAKGFFYWYATNPFLT